MAAMPQIELVLTIGLYAQAWHMGETRGRSLTETVMSWREVFAALLHGRWCCRCRIRPWRNTGWLKKNPWFEMDLLPFENGNSPSPGRGCEQIIPAD